jgi:NAD(P)-dependent dehydrogenase (short-subunit alcohol dehydrogenase family)
MAHDFGPRGIRVNAIAPGEIDTAILSPGTEKIVEEQIPMRRLGTPDEVADVIHFLCEKVRPMFPAPRFRSTAASTSRRLPWTRSAA